jgi:hypothetical protein
MCGPETCHANACLPVPRGVADRWDPRDVTVASTVTSPSSPWIFPFCWRRHAKAPWSPSWHRRGVPPRASAASWPTMCPSAPATISSRAAAPRVLPTLAVSVENPPLSTPPLEKEKGGEGKEAEEESEAVCGNAVRREDRSRPWEELDPPSWSAPASSASTSPRRHLLPPRHRTMSPFFTDACATTRGH